MDLTKFIVTKFNKQWTLKRWQPKILQVYYVKDDYFDVS
jgi:hypothetical protein